MIAFLFTLTYLPWTLYNIYIKSLALSSWWFSCREGVPSSSASTHVYGKINVYISVTIEWNVARRT